MCFFRFFKILSLIFKFYIDINSIFYYKACFIILYPIFFAILLTGFWLSYKILYKSEILERLLICIAISFMFFLSPIINILADFFNCTHLYENQYMTNFLLEKCIDNSTYDFWKNILILPAVAIYVISFPLILFSFMFKNRKRLFDKNFRAKIGFLLNGYSSQTYYW